MQKGKNAMERKIFDLWNTGMEIKLQMVFVKEKLSFHVHLPAVSAWQVFSQTFCYLDTEHEKIILIANQIHQHQNVSV